MTNRNTVLRHEIESSTDGQQWQVLAQGRRQRAT